ncbi:MAG: 3-dehydroquinate synthase [Bryobacter sp.]|nr:3-dehydroquinate synthase [Bryobacter sp.]
MPSFPVETANASYYAVVERGLLHNLLPRVSEFLPARRGKIFVVTTEDVWRHHGTAFRDAMRQQPFDVLFFPGGESRKRLAEVEALAEQMVALGADRASLVIGFGGGIVTDVAGFLAAIFLRGVPVLQIPTTLLGQVDAAVGGKTGVNLVSGKNLIGSFHQPLAVLIDPDVLRTLPAREYRAGLYEVLKCGVIRSQPLFERMAKESAAILAQEPALVEEIIAESVRIKCEVVTADEKEGDLRRILNFGHTIGHALEAETQYQLLLHGEAVAFGMKAATQLAHLTGHLAAGPCQEILQAIDAYGEIPPLAGITADSLLARLSADKKTLHGKVHFVLPVRIGEVVIQSGIDSSLIREATDFALGAVRA